jgi:hypothetical protein
MLASAAEWIPFHAKCTIDDRVGDSVAGHLAAAQYAQGQGVTFRAEIEACCVLEGARVRIVQVELVFGNNQFAGGDNSVPFGSPVYLRGSTVTFDGRVVIDAGELKF